VNRYTPEERDRFACTFQNKEKEQVTNLHTLAALAANTTSVHLPGWLGPVAIGVIIIIVLAIVVKTLWKVPDADEALIITGFGVKGRAVGDRVFKVVTGGGAFVWPVLQKAQYLGMSADKALLEVEGVDSQKIPVGVRGVAIFKVGDDERSITNAATRFLEAQQGQMHDLVREVFHGHLRSIIGGLSVEDLIANRNELAQQTRDASADEMQKLGLVIDSLQVQDIVDPTGYIKALGEPRAAEVKMRARIAAAAADREATEREQEAEALKAASRRDSEIKRAAYQAEIDKQAAVSAQAGPLADAESRKQVVVQETAVAELEAEREEKRLDTQVRKPADAAAYEKQVQAEAERVARISIAEAQAREVELAAAAKAKQIEQIGTSEAKITSPRGIAEGEATKAKGEAEGASIRAKGLAEAESIAKRAEALEKEADAVIGQQIAEQLPEIVRAAAESFKHVDNLTVLNGAQGISEILAQVIGQAGPALEVAQAALNRGNNGNGTSTNGSTPSSEVEAGARAS
jgi:flotillin